MPWLRSSSVSPSLLCFLSSPPGTWQEKEYLPPAYTSSALLAPSGCSSWGGRWALPWLCPSALCRQWAKGWFYTPVWLLTCCVSTSSVLGVHSSSKIWSIWGANGFLWWEQYFSLYLFQCHTSACQVSVHFALLNSTRLQDIYLLIEHLIFFSEREIAPWKRFDFFLENFFQFCAHFLSFLKCFDIWCPGVCKITWLQLCQNKNCFFKAVCLLFQTLHELEVL